MILLNYEKKKIVHVQCGLQVSTFWPSSEDTICSWYMYVLKRILDLGLTLVSILTKQNKFISFLFEFL